MRVASTKEGEEIRGAVCVRVCLCGKEREGEREDERDIDIESSTKKTLLCKRHSALQPHTHPASKFVEEVRVPCESVHKERSV